MASGFSGGRPDFFAGADRPTTSLKTPYNTNLNPNQHFPFQSGMIPDPANQIRRPDLIGKRSITDFQLQNQQGLGFYHRNVKPRPNYHHALSPVDFSPVPSFSTISGTNISGPGVLFGSDYVNKTINSKLQELEKELLGDEENEEETVSVITNNDWPETIQNLLVPSPGPKPVSASPDKTTSPSSSSSYSSTSASPQISTKQSFIDAANAISDGNCSLAAEILTRLQQFADPRGNSEQRLTAYVVQALRRRVNPMEKHSPASELYSQAHNLGIQMLYEVSPCFKLGFMAANLAILESASERGFRKIHVVDFDIGSGGQYMHFLHALAARKSDNNAARATELRITAVVLDFISGDEQKLKLVGEGLKALANKIGVCLNFSIKKSNIADLSSENLGIEHDESLAVNLAFKLHKLPDESVTTENLRDNLLRRVKSLCPAVTTVVEQDLNINTAPLTARVRENYDYHKALFDSLEATMGRENLERVRVEEALGRKMGNSVGLEGKDRVERCEVLGKWRARMSMAGFESVLVTQPLAESLRAKLNSGTRGNPGFTVDEQSGGLCFGWMGRTLTVVSAWR